MYLVKHATGHSRTQIEEFALGRTSSTFKALLGVVAQLAPGDCRRLLQHSTVCQLGQFKVCAL